MVTPALRGGTSDAKICLKRENVKRTTSISVSLQIQCEQVLDQPHFLRWWCVSAGQTGIVAGVCAVLFILLLISGGIVWRMCRKKAKKDNYAAKRLGRGCLFWPVGVGFLPGRKVTKVCVYRKVYSAPNKLNTVFQPLDPKARPQIGEPTLMESTAAQVFTPLTRSPSRAPPQVGQQSSTSQSPLSWQQSIYYSYFFFFFNSQPPKKFSAPSPISQRDEVSYLFIHMSEESSSIFKSCFPLV